MTEEPEQERQGKHGSGPVRHWEPKHAAESFGAGLLVFVLMTLAGPWTAEPPIVARLVVALLTTLVVYFRFG